MQVRSSTATGCGGESCVCLTEGRYNTVVNFVQHVLQGETGAWCVYVETVVKEWMGTVRAD